MLVKIYDLRRDFTREILPVEMLPGNFLAILGVFQPKNVRYHGTYSFLPAMHFFGFFGENYA